MKTTISTGWVIKAERITELMDNLTGCFVVKFVSPEGIESEHIATTDDRLKMEVMDFVDAMGDEWNDDAAKARGLIRRVKGV